MTALLTLPSTPTFQVERLRPLSGVTSHGEVATLELAAAVSIPVIASGGLASLDDVERLLQPDCARLAGAISGRALYDGRLDPAKALQLIRAAREAAGA